MIGLGLKDLTTGGTRVWLQLAGVAIVLAGAFGAGWMVNGWRLTAGHAREIAALTSESTNLKAKIQTQNFAVDVLNERKNAADERRRLAEVLTKAAQVGLQNRADQVAASKATDCDGVLREAWGAR